MYAIVQILTGQSVATETEQWVWHLRLKMQVEAKAILGTCLAE